MGEVKISVIIPVYNVENYIEECLLSVLHQTIKEIEIICVNDGTIDNSIRIIQKYEQIDKRIKIINKKNGGLSSARNAGFKVASGEYIYYLDSDDYILENTLEILYKEVKKDDLDTIFFDADSFFETEELELSHASYRNYYHRDNLYSEPVNGSVLLKKFMDNHDFRPSACLQLNRRSMLLEHNIDFYEGIIHEDNLFTLKVLLYSQKAKHISQAFYMRRVRANSIMTLTNEIKSVYGYFICIQEIIKELKTLKNIDEDYSIFLECISTIQKSIVNILYKIPQKDLEDLVISSCGFQNIQFALYFKNFAEYKRHISLVISKKDAKITALSRIKNSMEYKIGSTITGFFKKIKTYLKKIKNLSIKKIIKKLIRLTFPDLYTKLFTKISIIIPVYNGEKYLQKCLDSLRKQSLYDIQVICIDDGSTDESLNILNEFKKLDKRFLVLNQNHEGAGNARNYGINYAIGKYLLFLDCDDLFNKHLCKKVYEKARENDAEVVLFGAKRKNMLNSKTENMGWVLRSNKLPKDIVFSGEEKAEEIFQITSNCPWSKLFSKKYVIENNLYFQNIKHANDAYFVRIAIAMAKRMVILDEPLVTYRFNIENNIQSVKDLEPLEFHKAFIAVKNKLIELGCFNQFEKSYVNWTLTESLFNYNTMKSDQAKKEIKTMLKKEGFEFYGIGKYTRNDFYDPLLYDQYKAF